MLNALWIPLTVQDTALMAIAVPATTIRLAPENHVFVLAVLASTVALATAVVPLFAGFDTARSTGRIFNYDVTGGHYEDTDFQATGSGGRDARSTIKLGWQEGLARDEAVDLAIQSLYDAADEDSATGGPDLVRGMPPGTAKCQRTRWPSGSAH